MTPNQPEASSVELPEPAGRHTEWDCDAQDYRPIGRHHTAAQLEAYAAAKVREALERLTAENENLRSVMIAAAEEIHEHWDAHCDSEGYGPANLMHRLEQGIPAQYAYKAGDFERMRMELAALRERLEAAELGAKRYETLRRFNASQFTDAFVLNRRTGKPFDEIVDDMRPFMFPAMSANTKEGR